MRATQAPGSQADNSEVDDAHWSCLPDELLTQVGAHLSLAGCDLSGMRGVCKSWRASAAALEVEAVPLGPMPDLAAFPAIASLDYARRGQAHSLTDDELSRACGASAASVRSLDISGAFQLTRVGVAAVAACRRLTRVRCAGSALEDSHVEALGALPCLEELALPGCLFLRGDFFPALRPCASLWSLDLSGCGLGLAINPAAVEALASLPSLTHLDLSHGNGVGDEACAAIGEMPRLRSLRVRGAREVSDAGLALLAAGRCAPRLHTLDVSGCTRLTDGCWAALAGFPELEELRLDCLPGLLRHLPLPEALAGAAWRWRRLARLGLAGSCVHPSKFKVLAETCGGTLQELDISDGGALGGEAHRRARLPGTEALCAAARALRRLDAAGSGLPLAAVLVFLRRGRGLEALDLSRCSLGDGGGGAAQSGQRPGWAPGQGLGMTSVRRALDFDSFPAAAGVSMRSLMDQAAPRCPEPSPADFACALGALSALKSLRLAGCPGLGPAHLAHLSSLSALSKLSLAGAGAAGDFAAAQVAAAPCLAALDLSATQLTDAGLAHLTAASSLRDLTIARNGGVTAAGLAALGAHALRTLDASGCGALGDAAAAGLAAAFPGLHALSLSGCGSITPAGLAPLGTLRRLRSLSLARCPAAVSDAALLPLCRQLSRLTRLDLSSSQDLTPEGLAAALALLPSLADLDLTGSGGLADDCVGPALAGLTKANVEMPGGGRAPTGSPLRRR